MSFKAGNTVIGQLPKESVDPYKGLPSFSEDEFAYLFYKLENMEFKGKEMEQIFLGDNVQEKREFLKKFIEKVIVRTEGIEIVYYSPGQSFL